MKKCLAFALGGGGARGAMQVGALRALLEAGFKPDLLVGTSIGAVNATGLALWGVNLAGIEALERGYQEFAVLNLMDPRFVRLKLRLFSRRPNHQVTRRVSEFLTAKGLTPDLRFDQITDVRLALISADLASGQPVIYGQDSGQSILEGLLAAIALPPWFAPIENDGQYIVDGGVLSNVPIEPAMTMGATKIIALDVDSPGPLAKNNLTFNQYLEKLVFALSQRHIRLETAIAEAQGVPVRCIELRSPVTTPSWDFRDYKQLMRIGYETAALKIADWLKFSQTKFTLSDTTAELLPEPWVS